MMDAVILAAGKGERLKPVTDKIPKPLIKIRGKPILEWILQDLAKNNITNIYIIVNYMQDKIKEFVDTIKDMYGLKIAYIHQPEIIGEVNAISLLPKEISDHFIVLMGDIIISNLKYKEIIEKGYPGIVIKRTKDFIRKGIVEGENGFIKECYYNMDKVFNEEKMVDYGPYILSKELLEVARGIKDPEKNKVYIPDIINRMIKKGKKFMYFEHKDEVIHISSLEDLEKHK